MERARRAAESPLRAILEAAKLRRRIEPEVAGEATAARRALAARPAADGPGRTEPVRVEPTEVTIPAATPPVPAHGAGAAVPRAAAPPAAPVATPLLVADSPVTTIRTLPNEALPEVPSRSTALASSAIAPLRSAPSLSVLADLPRPQPLPAATAPPSAAARAPELVHMVEPETTPRQLELLARPEVTVEFTIRTDGSVSDVRVLPPVPSMLVPPISAAVEQWRFAPLPAARPHRVVLVFKNGG